MSESGRSCGTCSLCCKILHIPELQKPAGSWCPHAAPGKGCGVYDERPSSCRTFMCQWLHQADVPEELKPSRSKVVLTAVQGERDAQLVAHCDPNDPTAWRRGAMYAFLKGQTGAGGGGQIRTVTVWVGRRLWLITPRGEHDLGEPTGRRSFALELGPDGREVARLVDTPDAEPEG